jgi:hypothetical protein
MRGLWRRLFEALARADPGDVQAIDSTTAKVAQDARIAKQGCPSTAFLINFCNR